MQVTFFYVLIACFTMNILSNCIETKLKKKKKKKKNYVLVGCKSPGMTSMVNF